MTDNLRFYTPGAVVPKEACKDFNNGKFSGTDINRMWRVKVLTEMFGPAGIGWDFKLVDVHTEPVPMTGEVAIFAKGELKVKDPDTGEWSEPIVGYGGNYLIKGVAIKDSNGYKIKNDDGSFKLRLEFSDEAYKMVETDSFGSACSKLGIGASVYWNELTKYTANQSNEEGVQKSSTPKVVPSADKGPDKFFGSKAKADKSASQTSPMTGPSAQATPSKSDLDTILDAESNPKLKEMVIEWKRKNGVHTLYETLPEQRAELANMVRSVA